MLYHVNAYCGIDCGKCEVLLANKNNELETLAKKRKMNPSDLKCFGCKSGSNTSWCATCKIKSCAKNKQIDFCYLQCNEYPCELIHEHTNVLVYRKDSYCGLYCGGCELFQATQNGTLDELGKKRDMKAYELECYGCKSVRTSVYCSNCKIKLCASGRKVEFCYRCDEYPCKSLLKFNNPKYLHKCLAMKNLERIRDQGLEKWLDEQKDRWSCPECNTKYSYYADLCQKCGAKLYNCEDEVKEEDEKEISGV